AALGWPTASIDDERLTLLRPGKAWPADDGVAWANLRKRIRGGRCIVETAGTSAREAILFGGLRRFVVRVSEPDPVRRRRLTERATTHPFAADDPAAYVRRCMEVPAPAPGDVEWDGNLERLVEQIVPWATAPQRSR